MTKGDGSYTFPFTICGSAGGSIQATTMASFNGSVQNYTFGHPVA